MLSLLNSVNRKTGRKYEYKKGDWEKKIQPLVNEVCSSYGLSTLDIQAARNKKEEKKQEKSKRNQQIQKDLEKGLLQSHTWEEFLECLEDMGYSLRGKKHLAVLEPDAVSERYRRIDTISEAYTEENIRKRLAVRKEEKNQLYFLYIPYRKRHLTRYQKQVFVRRYQKANAKRYGKFSWKNKNVLKQLERLQEEYWFLARYTAVEQGLEELKKEQSRLKEERLLFDRERKAYQPLLDEIFRMQELKVEADLYEKEGYPEFYPAYEEYKTAQRKYEDKGYSQEMLEKIRIYFQTQEQVLEKKEQDVKKQIRVGQYLKKRRYRKTETIEKRAQTEIGIRKE